MESGYENTDVCNECGGVLTLDNLSRDAEVNHLTAARVPICKSCYDKLTTLNVTCVKCAVAFTALPSTNLHEPVCKSCKKLLRKKSSTRQIQ